MRAFLIVMTCVALVAVLVTVGCGKKDDTSVKPMKEYREQAVKDVDPNNPEGELDKIEKAVDEDSK